MSKEVVNKVKKAIHLFEKKDGLANEKQKTKIIRDVFYHLLSLEGYKPANRMSYYTYIAENNKHDTLKTIGISFQEDLKEINKEEVERWIASGTIKGIDKIILYTDALITPDAHDFERDVYDPVIIEQKNLTDIKKWVTSVEADFDESEVAIVLRKCIQKFIELIVQNPAKTLAELEWRDIERVIAELFHGLGFKTTLTPPSKDGGKDVIVELITENKKQSYIIEIKHWRSQQKVGVGAVKDFLKIVAKEKRDGGLFLSTYGFAENMLESLTSIEKKSVKYGKEEKIHSLCNTYLKRKSGIWLGELDLKNILYDDTMPI